MDDALRAWWAHELSFHGWEGRDPLQALSAVRAHARLSRLNIGDRGELAWRLLEASNGRHLRRDALELLALGGCVGWLGEARIAAWLEHFRHKESNIAALWPDRTGEAIWRARAAFAPVLETAFDAVADWPDAAGWLAQVWAVHDRDDLVRILLWLASQGHRYGWDVDAARLKQFDRASRIAWLASLGEERGYGRVLLDYLDRDEPLDWAAWDWLRLVDLTYAGAVLGWLSADEAQCFAAHGVDLLQQRYDDWTSVAMAYQRGRSLFEGRDQTAAFDEDWGLLLGTDNSPWHMPLERLLDDATRQASRLAIRQWRKASYHWVLAIASVREPDLLYRQGLAMPLDEARIEDARTYLRETLDWDADSDAEGLAHYWLPGQAHHLNQLAADALHKALPPLTMPFFGQVADRGAIAVRDRLEHCAAHAATIYMAEKYAFYLLMVSDSGECPAQALAPLFASLAGVLSRFYASSQYLLEAWLAWETALPESAQESLAIDIRWHSGDPGSLFHWLDWQGAEWREPGPRPPLSMFTALALVGPLNAPIWGEPQPQRGSPASEVREWLDSHYALHTEESLKAFLTFLVEAGDRQEYQINYAPYTLNRRRLVEEIAILESGQRSEDEQVHLERLKRVRDNDNGCNDIDMAAWDAAQLVDLAVAGRQLDWLSRRELLTYLDHGLALAKTHYGSWQAYARGLYTGYAFFMMDSPERGHFLDEFRNAIRAWLSGVPPLAGAWSSLDFPGAPSGHWPPMHVDTLPGDAKTLH